MTASHSLRTTVASENEVARSHSATKPRSIKLLVWDLDNTLWRGTLLEGDPVQLRSGVREVLAVLDQRGILHSVASKNDCEMAMQKLTELGLQNYFLYPQINWSSKAANILKITQSLNIAADAVAFIDDEEFEREEVRHAVPDVLILDAADVEGLAGKEELTPRIVTADSARRREMYQAELNRKSAEEEFVGPTEQFLASLNMNLSISKAKQEDLSRAEELTLRTNQLNTTGYTYSFDELSALRASPNHLLLVAALDDKFGTYGNIGLVLIERSNAVWTIKLLLISCRVMSRGVGALIINELLIAARTKGVRLCGEFRPTGRNRMMMIAYRFSGFRAVDQRGDMTIFEHDLAEVQPHPSWAHVFSSDLE